MTDVRAFRAWRYDPDGVDLSRVIVPPYDVIAAEDRGRLFDRDPHSAIRLELTRDPGEQLETDYQDVARTLAQWCREGVLVHDAEPALYVLRQRFTAPDGSELTRDGFFAELRLEDYDRGVVRPHERTLAGPKRDRLKLLRATRANLSSVFLLYEDRGQELSARLSRALEEGALARARDDTGIEYTLAAMRDREAVKAVAGFLAERPTVIADGHHRYETALAYRDERGGDGRGGSGDRPWAWTLAYFANAFAPGSLLLPIHRVVLEGSAPSGADWDAHLSGWQHATVSVGDADAVPAALEEHLAARGEHPAFAADDGSGRLHLFWRPQPLGDRLMTRLLESEVLEPVFGLDAARIREGAVAFPKSALQAARDVRNGKGAVALYLNPLQPEDVFRVTEAGERMPQKSTFFYPKVPTGLVFRLHEAPA